MYDDTASGLCPDWSYGGYNFFRVDYTYDYLGCGTWSRDYDYDYYGDKACYVYSPYNRASRGVSLLILHM